MNFEYCPECGEIVDRGLTEVAGGAECENCETRVEPITDADNAAMPFKAFHPIRCVDCEEPVRLVGLHMGEFSDGVLAACECNSLSALPYELGEAELPPTWQIDHTEVVGDGSLGADGEGGLSDDQHPLDGSWDEQEGGDIHG